MAVIEMVIKEPGERVRVDVSVQNIGRIGHTFNSRMMVNNNQVADRPLVIGQGQIKTYSTSFDAPGDSGSHSFQVIISDDTGRELDRASDSIVVKGFEARIGFEVRDSSNNSPIPSVSLFYDSRYFITSTSGVATIDTNTEVTTVTFRKGGYGELTVNYDTSRDRSYVVYLDPIGPPLEDYAVEILNLRYPIYNVTPGTFFSVGVDVKNTGALKSAFDVRLKIPGLFSWLWRTSIPVGETKSFTRVPLAPNVSGVFDLEAEVWHNGTLLDKQVVPGAIVIFL